MQILARIDERKFPRVRLVGVGASAIVAFREAIDRAEQEGLDLVLVSDTVTPPVVKIQDNKKLEYEKKKARSKHVRTSTLKEIQLKVNISDHDLQTKLSAVDRFLTRGDKVKIIVRLKGRERDTPERAHQLLARVCEMVKAKITKIPGPIAIVLLEPAK